MGDRFTIRGRVVPADSATAAVLGPSFAAEAADVAERIRHPPLGAYITCLGNILGADIRFCPQLGLNVHGKALFILIRSATSIEVIADRNVFGRVVQVAGSRWEAWRARRGPASDLLMVTSGTTDVPLDDDGAFSVSVAIPRGARHPIRVTTGAGETTVIGVGWNTREPAAH